MKIRYVVGDLIASDQILIGHGCNAKGRFSSGIAGTIRDRLPFAYEAYRNAFEDASFAFSIGAVIWAFDIGSKNRPRIVANLITQQDYGRDPERVYVSYEAIMDCLRCLNEFVAKTHDGSSDLQGIGPLSEVGLPLLGCGLGNGQWSIVADIIERESHCFQPVVYHHANEKKNPPV